MLFSRFGGNGLADLLLHFPLDLFVVMSDRTPPERSVRLREVDRTHFGQIGHEEPGERGDGPVDIER